MAKEIERKFLIAADEWRCNADTGTRLRQGYIVTMNDRSTRVRIFDGVRAAITVKIGRTALSRDEFEYQIPVADAEQMLEQAVGFVIDKTRYRVPVDGFTFEVDVYHGPLLGLVVAEVELASETDKPTLPDWIGHEVTGIRHFSNQHLAMSGLSVLHLPAA